MWPWPTFVLLIVTEIEVVFHIQSDLCRCDWGAGVSVWYFIREETGFVTFLCCPHLSYHMSSGEARGRYLIFWVWQEQEEGVSRRQWTGVKLLRYRPRIVLKITRGTWAPDVQFVTSNKSYNSTIWPFRFLILHKCSIKMKQGRLGTWIRSCKLRELG